MATSPSTSDSPGGLTTFGRIVILITAFLGWMFAGFQMSITPLVSHSAVNSFLWPGQSEQKLSLDEEKARKTIRGKWFARNNALFLLGAAAGGWGLGWFGDRLGRSKAMGASILCFSVFAGLALFARSPLEFVLFRFMSGLGVGGMWPNGIALVSEAWPNVSRPALAGVIGTAANVGLVLMGLAANIRPITPDDWHWMMLLGASTGVLGLLSLALVPESPRWLAGRVQQTAPPPVGEIFRGPLLKITLIGICLGTIPLYGGWGSGNWLVPWSDEEGAKRNEKGEAKDTTLKARIQVARSAGGTISSLLGGFLASLLGRRRSYFLISLGSLTVSFYLFNFLKPFDATFIPFVFLLGLISGFFFGWLPLCLPELFPTRVRSTGAGVTFNFGRVATAIGVLGAVYLVDRFEGDYPKVMGINSLVYALGMVVIWFAPDTSKKGLSD
jgi:SHS family sialic acid transporter-like MFS transporter